MLGYRCPNHIDFYVKIPDGRDARAETCPACGGKIRGGSCRDCGWVDTGSELADWRKAWAACYDHLPEVILQMQAAYGGDQPYEGEYLLRVRA